MIYAQPLKIITHLASQIYVLPFANDRTAGDNSAGLQIHLQTHGSQSNASKHDQLTNKIFQIGI